MSKMLFWEGYGPDYFLVDKKNKLSGVRQRRNSPGCNLPAISCFNISVLVQNVYKMSEIQKKCPS